MSELDFLERISAVSQPVAPQRPAAVVVQRLLRQLAIAVAVQPVVVVVAQWQPVAAVVVVLRL